MNHSVFLLEARNSERTQQADEINEFVLNALQCAIQHVLRNIATAVVVTISTSTDRAELWYHHIMSKLFATWGFMAFQLVVHDSRHKDVQVPGRRFCNIIMVDSLDSLHRTNISEYNRNYDTVDYYFIFLQIHDAAMPLQREMILKYCLDNYWLHCNVMVQNASGDVFIYTYFPFQESGCFLTDPVLINQFDGERFVNDDMFPDKMQHLHGCPVKLSTWDIPPFIDFQPNADEPWTGLEMVILRSLSVDMNFSLELDNSTTERSLETNFAVEQDALELLRRRETNISAGYFRRTVATDAAATPSIVTYNLPLVAVVMRRRNLYAPMDILTFPFDNCTWWLLIISCIALIIINSIKRKCERAYNCWHIVEVLLGVAIWRVPNSLSRRLNFIIWVLSTFVLRSSYQSLLFYLYRTHFYRASPQSLAELVQSDYKVVCTLRSEQLLKYVPELMDVNLTLLVLNTSNEMEPLRFMEEHSDQNLVVMSVKDFIFHYAHRELQPGNALLVLSESVNNQQIAFYFTKHSYLVRRFNECLLRFHQAGLLEYWRKKSIESNRLTTRTGNTRKLQKELFIDMQQLLGLMPVIVFLDSIALVIFALELLSKRVTILQKLL